jgi:hypothetical protein
MNASFVWAGRKAAQVTRISVFALILSASLTVPMSAQISRHPTGVNVSAQGATTVFLTFGNLDGYVADEAIWCGELVSAAPDIGNMCDSSTIFGSLPLQFNLSQESGDDGFTDIMNIPPSVARRAYQAAANGAVSSFFYVRRFIDPEGVRPDQYVTVTCRLTGGGARVPMALLDVQVNFTDDQTVRIIPEGQTLPPISAKILYNGTGILQGRWEIVMPGDEMPTANDLLTEATLPDELRGTQRRYTEIERFYYFLDPVGEFTLPGPDPEKLPTDVEGQYMLLLRIEASSDKEGDSNLASAGAGDGTVFSAAVAGFPMPPLRYYVGSADNVTPVFSSGLALVAPLADAVLPSQTALAFTWTEVPEATLYRVQVRAVTGDMVLSAVLEAGSVAYQAPPLLEDWAPEGFQWRVLALGPTGAVVSSTSWRRATWEGQSRATLLPNTP